MLASASDATTRASSASPWPYEKVRHLGKGGYGQVYLCRDEDGKLLVTKEIAIHSASERDEVAREAEMLSLVSHPNVIHFERLHRVGAKMAIVMEYADDGDVESKLASRRPRRLHLPRAVVAQWMMQLLQALEHLHGHGIIHRDVKTANLFLTKNGFLKLGDFGVAKVLARNASAVGGRTTATPLGTPMYIPPEICVAERYTQRADMWAAGCCLYEMCALEPAFTAKSIEHLMKRICKGAFKASRLPKQYGQEVSDLVSHLLSVNPDERPNAAEALETPFVAEWVAESPAERTRRGVPLIPFGRLPDPAELASKSTPDVMRLDDDVTTTTTNSSDADAYADADTAAVSPTPTATAIQADPRRQRGHRRTSSDGGPNAMALGPIKPLHSTPPLPAIQRGRSRSPSPLSMPTASRSHARASREPARDPSDPWLLSPPTPSPTCARHSPVSSPLTWRARGVASNDTLLSPPSPHSGGGAHSLSPESPRMSRRPSIGVRLTTLGAHRQAGRRVAPGPRSRSVDPPGRRTPVAPVDVVAPAAPASNKLADHVAFYSEHSPRPYQHPRHRSPRQSPRPSPRHGRKSLPAALP
eukprot:m.68816 g.68816  ORF g.68816 m.68816 type:complete len:586 (+) comp8540_c0_seq2:305-2062(+)